MKKMTLLSLCLLAGVTASAQMTVVKEAENAMKDKAEAKKVVEIMTPAFSNPETAELAVTYFVPGKASYNQYDELIGMRAFGKLPENGEALMANLLLDGYDYFMKALPLDSVANDKGKIKTKYSKEMINTIAGHYTDFNDAAITFWNNKQYDKAYKAWGTFVDMPKDPRFAKGLNGVPADTLMAEIMFNQGLAAWQSNDFKKALEAFEKAKSNGYKKKQLYDYAIAVALQVPDQEAVLDIASEALPLYGKENPDYMGHIVNYYLQKKEYDKALAKIQEAVADDPDNSQYHVVQGILYEQTDQKPLAKAEYEKAVQLNDQNASALYNLGRAICDEAFAINDKAPTNEAEYTKVLNEQITPLFKQAAEYLEKAVDIDENQTDALRYLENIYYNLKDEKNLQLTKQRMGN